MTDDRLAIQDLVARYASAADRRDVDALVGLFSSDAELVRPPALLRRGDSAVLQGREAIADSIVAALAPLHATYHLIGQQSATVRGDTATGEVYCMAHHIYLRGTDGDRDSFHDNVMAVRYLDDYERGPAGWVFTRREPVVVFSEDRPVRVG
ncbi:RNA polymerase factor sigma-70 [Mycobacteroides salmoniphilum]|uniref:RNA polymerase factor sigma-70 n=1 Tax=Mycobacteroides salmoniphilum TaxID=404941 RepID=A0A4R8S6J0_9MYCO|nr:nuclear transport factor 2 family protein [Mycobacteroides salmoniphilum]TDZ87301.1 RNA polymerase factor sigma-70 [Mycobacteroides salmoniphilum]